MKDYKYKPLSCEEVIAHIEGRGYTRPPFAATPMLYKPSELQDEKKIAKAKQLLDIYPDDIQCFSYVRPKNFGNPGEYCWCDVPGSDPSLHRIDRVGIDEETAVSWDIINRISDLCPDPYAVDELIVDPKEPDGRYRAMFWTRCCFERLWHFRGMENALCDFYLYPKEVHLFFRRLLKIYKRAIDRAKEEYNMNAWIMTDDIGTQNGPFFSEEMFVEFFKPIYKELIEYIHSKGMHMWLHTCGNIESFIPHLIDCGLDVLHPIQKYTMNEKNIVDKFGNKICFWAGMDVQRTLPFGTTEQVRQETRYMIDTFYLENKGRLILGPGNNMTVEDIPIQNVEAFMDEARKYGQEVYEHGKQGKNYSPFGHKVNEVES